MGITETGLILIGDELLRGNRQDKHMEYMIGLLDDRGMELSWVRIVGDEGAQITETLRDTMARPALVFSFGGIGATPDDVTRTSAAEAIGVAVERHPEAVSLLEDQFGEAAYPKRILMAELPAGAALIPNPVNRVPGFKLGHHHFLPGFPNMAWPMAEWVLDTHYSQLFNDNPRAEERLYILNTPESELIDQMNRLLERYPELGLSSLPDTRNRKRIDFGLKGPRQVVDAARTELLEWLDEEGIDWAPLDGS
jgi:molybdopterin-biosynthesis enzyme MoeA-like protein